MERDYTKENSLEARIENVIDRHRSFLTSFRRKADNFVEIDDITAYTEVSKIAQEANDITKKFILGLVHRAIEDNVNFYEERFVKEVNPKQFANDIKFSLAELLTDYQ